MKTTHSSLQSGSRSSSGSSGTGLNNGSGTGRRRPPRVRRTVLPYIAAAVVLLTAVIGIWQPWNVKIGSERVPYTDVRTCADELGISPAELIHQLRQEEKGTRLIETLLDGISIDQGSPDDIDANAAAIVRDMQASGVFDTVTYDADTQTITYTYPGGVSGFISLSDTSDISGLSASGTAAGTASFSPLSAGVLNTPDKRVYIRTGSGSPSVSVLLLYAFIGDEDESTRVQLIESTINWSSVNVDLTIDTSVTLDDLCRLGGYDVVYVDTHGCTIDSNRDSGFRTNEVKSSSADLKYRVSEQQNEIRYCTGYHYGSNNVTEYFVTSGFFSRNIVTAPDGLFYSGSCQFYGSDDKNAQYTYKLADTLLSLGAKAVIGFRNSVYTRYDESLACRIITDLAQGASVGEAYDKETNYGTATDGKPASELSAFALLRGNSDYRAVVGVTPTPEPTAVPEMQTPPAPTATPKPTATPTPTATPKPTATPSPTATPAPTAIPATTVPAPSDPLTAFGIGYRDHVVNGTYYSVEDILKLVHDTYYNRHDANGSKAPGHSARRVANDSYGYVFSFYYGDGLLYFAEVRNSVSKETMVKLYFWGDTLYGYRDYRISDHSLYTSGAGLDAINREFNYVFSYGMSCA